MELLWILLASILHLYVEGQGVYAPASGQIVHSGQACVVKDDNISERVYTIREGDMLMLQCLVKGHPRPQVRWTKTAGSASDKFQETSIFNETLQIQNIQRIQGGRYYCKAENRIGVPAIKSIRVDVQYLDMPTLTVHQTISDVRGSYYQEKTVFLRCTVNSNPPARFIWKRGSEVITHNQDNGVDIYEPLYTQGETKVLKLKNLRPQDFANYTCQVSVRNVCSIPDKSITFQLTNATSPPALKLSVDETLVVNPGDNVTMSCLVAGGIPTPEISWTHYPGPIPTTARVQGGTMILQNVKVQDSGYYNCTAVNNVGNPAKKTVNLIVRAMSNITFQITPDPNKDSETIQMEQDVKLSCHVDAQPQDKVNYTWYKNGLPVRPSKTLVILRNDPELDPGTCSLEIFYMNFRDQATYSCVASFTGTPIPELKIEVNLTRNTVVPPVLTVPKDRATVMVREGSRAELQCDVSGKPRPPVLWSRADKEMPMPSGDWLVETRDGKLRLDNVTRDMSGSYRCQTARFNGLNIKPRQALVQLSVQFAPIVDPQSLDVRTRTGESVTLRCTMLKANPQRIASSTWRLNGRLIRSSRPELQDYSEWQIDSFSQLSNGTYECSISNDVGTSICIFYVSAKAYNPEFYYDTPAPIKKDNRNYSYTLQWTQREPEAVDVVIGYKLEVRQLNFQSYMSKQIQVGTPQKGVLLQHILTDLKIPLSYEVRLTPITNFGPGDTSMRIIEYSEPYSYPGRSDQTCGFEVEKICGFTQDKKDDFDWMRQNANTQNPKRSPNTGPTKDRSGTREGYYMYIEASRPRVPGDKARLVSPLYNVTTKAKGPYSTPFCISFYYHMYGKHIGSLNVLLRVKSVGALDMQVWTLSGNQGPDWQQANITINPRGPFQVVFEGVRGSGYEGDIAIDDVYVARGKCPMNRETMSEAVSVKGSSAALSLPIYTVLLALFLTALFHR
ncbi:MAM domain-containing glycosylphosphatidylinositol anchor protein 1 [Polyodon spathula]|uniref:MAM domain-containing glycosylphosphatidylinositol anchor protein 1 n=1 Tax=Polyodon spathula TaxID=7913 RepID=UPI001B7E4F7C|nr:MAM domain-containing glycosylphosphatidylinositol anchor protein 1 [Polyodon spathula]